MDAIKPGSQNVGLEVQKRFGAKKFKGWVTKYYEAEGSTHELYHVKYEDEDEEDVDFAELKKIIINAPRKTKAAAGQQRGASGSAAPAADKPRRSERASGAASEAGGNSDKLVPVKPKGLGSGSGLSKRAAASQPQPAAKKARLVFGNHAADRAASKAAKAAPAVPEVPGDHAEPPAADADAAGPSSKAVAEREPEEAAKHTAGDVVVDLDENSAPAANAVSHEGTGIQRSHPAHGGRPGAARFNQIVSFGDMLYLAGQVAADTKAPGMDTYYGQTKQVLGQVEQLLKQAGSSMDHLLQVAVHLRDITKGADEFNKAWEELIDMQHAPARTTVQAHLMRPDLLVEVTAIAAKRN